MEFIYTGWGMSDNELGILIGTPNDDGFDQRYLFEVKSYPETKRIAGLLLSLMFNELEVGYGLLMMDISLLGNSWKALIDEYTKKTDARTVGQWVDQSLRYVSVEHQLKAKKANCWEFVRSYLAVYIGIFKKCDEMIDFKRRCECVQLQFFIAWQFFVDKYLKNVVRP